MWDVYWDEKWFWTYIGGRWCGTYSGVFGGLEGIWWLAGIWDVCHHISHNIPLVGGKEVGGSGSVSIGCRPA